MVLLYWKIPLMERVTQAENITAALERARGSLPPNINASRENVLIAGTPRRELKSHIRDARESARDAQTGYEVGGRALNRVTNELLAATPQAGELLGDTPTTSEIRTRLEQVTAGYGKAWRELEAARKGEELANSTETQARRLGRLPQAIVAASTVALIGGGGFWAAQSLSSQARHELASGTVQTGTPRYRILQNQASGVQTDLTEGSLGGGSIVGGAAAWLLTGDRLARPRARITVARAKRRAAH
jgi:hypothetical protein